MPEKIGKYEVIERIGRGGMGLHHVRHDVHAPDDSEPALSHKFPECDRLFGVTLQQRLDQGNLIERKFVVGKFLQQAKHF